MQHFDSFAQMQRDAERRVMEMQKRAMAAIENSGDSCPSADNRPAEHEHTPPRIHSDRPLQEPQNQHTLSKLNLSDEDSERALLIVILLLLMHEDADERLIFALLYILL